MISVSYTHLFQIQLASSSQNYILSVSYGLMEYEVEQKDGSTMLDVYKRQAQSDVEEVLSSSRNFNTTLTLENGFFQDSVTADDITLGEAFEGMTVVGLSLIHI